jgi:hypothetical protein
LDEAGLSLGQLPPVISIHSNVTEGRCAVILHIDIRGRKELNEDRDGSSIDELLTVLVYLQVS